MNGCLVGDFTDSEGACEFCASLDGEDFELAGGGSVYILLPLSAAGFSWIDTNVESGALRWGRGIAIEHRYVYEIVQGISTISSRSRSHHSSASRSLTPD